MRIITDKHLTWLAIGISLAIGFFFFDRLRIDWMLTLYVITALIVGICVYMGEYEPAYLVRNKLRRLGPSYWGVYQGSSLSDLDGEQLIKPPKPCKDIEGLAGSGAYAGGKAVKTARG